MPMKLLIKSRSPWRNASIYTHESTNINGFEASWLKTKDTNISRVKPWPVLNHNEVYIGHTRDKHCQHEYHGPPKRGQADKHHLSRTAPEYALDSEYKSEAQRNVDSSAKKKSHSEQRNKTPSFGGHVQITHPHGTLTHYSSQAHEVQSNITTIWKPLRQTEI